RGADERPSRNLVRELIPVSRYVDEAAGQVLRPGIGHGMDKNVELAPAFAELVEQGLKLALNRHVARQKRHVSVPLQLGYKFLHVALQPVVLVCKSQLGAFSMQRPGNPPGDRPVIGHAHNQALFALHQCHSKNSSPSPSSTLHSSPPQANPSKRPSWPLTPALAALAGLTTLAPYSRPRRARRPMCTALRPAPPNGTRPRNVRPRPCRTACVREVSSPEDRPECAFLLRAPG